MLLKKLIQFLVIYRIRRNLRNMSKENVVIVGAARTPIGMIFVITSYFLTA